jgi:hypothetical protein
MIPGLPCPRFYPKGGLEFRPDVQSHCSEQYIAKHKNVVQNSNEEASILPPDQNSGEQRPAEFLLLQLSTEITPLGHIML